MMQSISDAPELDVLFDLFNEDFSDDMKNSSEVTDSLNDESDNTDDTSSESSGSSGHSSLSLSHSPPFQQLCTHYPSPPRPAPVVFAPNPLSSFTCETTHTINKRTKTEDKLFRNRESANKSRLKRKNEKSQLEATVASLTEQVRSLEMQNTALLTDNTTLSQHNFFLQELLKKQQLEHQAAAPPPVKAQSQTYASSQMSALSGISVLCVVFSVSFFNEWLPSSLSSAAGGGGQDSWGLAGGSSGRVLLSMHDDDDYGHDYDQQLSSSHSSQHPHVVLLRYLLILSSMFLYYFYIQYDNAVQKKSTRLLPS